MNELLFGSRQEVGREFVEPELKVTRTEQDGQVVVVLPPTTNVVNKDGASDCAPARHIERQPTAAARGLGVNGE